MALCMANACVNLSFIWFSTQLIDYTVPIFYLCVCECVCPTYVSQKPNKNPGNVNSNENIKWFSFKWLHHIVASEFHLQLPMLTLCVIHLRMSSSDFFIQSTTTTTTHPFFYCCCCCLWRTWHTPCAKLNKCIANEKYMSVGGIAVVIATTIFFAHSELHFMYIIMALPFAWHCITV